jgi:hypothetical protein
VCVCVCVWWYLESGLDDIDWEDNAGTYDASNGTYRKLVYKRDLDLLCILTPTHSMWSIECECVSVSMLRRGMGVW